MIDGKNKRIKIIIVLANVILFAFALWKIQLGMHSDEVHSIAVGDMIARGDTFFKECWFYLQMSAVFTAPVIKIYTLIVGSTDGILLLFRILSVFIQAGICLYFYHTFRERFNKKYTAVAAVILFAFVPDFQSFTYKQEIVWFSIMQIIFTYQYYWKRAKKYLVLLGIMISACVLAYPTSILQFPIYLGILCWINKSFDRKISDHIRDCAIVSATCVVCAVLFLTVVFQKISVAEFLEFFPKVFTDDNLDSSFISKLVHPLKKFAALGFLTVIPVFICRKMKWRKTELSLVMIGALFWMAFLGQCYIERKGLTWHCVTYPYALSVFMVPLLYWINGCQKEDRAVLMLFELPAVTVIFCIALASNQGNITSMYGGIVSMLAFFLLLGGKERMGETEKIPAVHKLIIGSVLFFALTMFAIPVYEQESVYVDNLEWRTVITQRIPVQYGPAKGISLGETTFERYNNLCSLIGEHVQSSDAVFIVDDAYTASYGYLCAKGKYATFSPQGGWGLATSERAVQYYKDNPQKQPTIVLINLEYIFSELDDYMTATPVGVFLTAHDYDMIECKSGYAVLRN